MAINLTRTLQLTNPLMQGADVKAVQALLTHSGFPTTVDGVFGAASGHSCVLAKTALKYPVAKRFPSCGPPLVSALEAHKPFPPPPVTTPRQAFLKVLHAFLADSVNWSYAQIRPFPLRGHVGHVVTDCTGAIGYGASVAEVANPFGHTTPGYGFTGTLLDVCIRIGRAQVLPGDLVVFGYGDGHHAAAFLDNALDPVLFSHGAQGDPRQVHLSAEASGQAASGHPGVTYLRFLT